MSVNTAINTDFIRRLPKAELHIHIEGSLEPELMFALARKHGIKLPYADVEAVRQAYEFNNLQEFLDIYYAGAAVLLDRADFRDLMFAYLKRAHADGVVHSEIFFDPQTHTARGVPFSTVIQGLTDGMAEGKRAKAAMPLVALVDQFYDRVQQRGGGRWDTCSLIQPLQKP